LACQALAHNAEQQAAIEEILCEVTHLHKTAQHSLEAMTQRWQNATNWTAWQTEAVSLLRGARSVGEGSGTPG
jgi:hypothetical protein